MGKGARKRKERQAAMDKSGDNNTLTWQAQPIHTTNTNDPISFTAFLSERKSRGQQLLLAEFDNGDIYGGYNLHPVGNYTKFNQAFLNGIEDVFHQPITYKNDTMFFGDDELVVMDYPVPGKKQKDIAVFCLNAERIYSRFKQGTELKRYLDKLYNVMVKQAEQQVK
ncbi:hypothetical protein [Lentilactobacillus kribbianus]|uniref:hypothetical protein n=1 Tax=Lentilactobacillus kribbianus TaxID=2729622 RepID=UPI0015579B39|nr:hypothetical protein [Lentilactobacillus kribbianus]